MYQGPIPEIWLVTGTSAHEAGALARAIAERMDRATLVDGDTLWDQVVAGRVDPDGSLEGEAERQHELVIRNQCLLARSYAEADFVPVLTFWFRTRHQLDAYRNYLLGGRVRLVIVGGDDEAFAELDALGLRVDAVDADAPGPIADAVIDRRDEAVLR